MVQKRTKRLLDAWRVDKTEIVNPWVTSRNIDVIELAPVAPPAEGQTPRVQGPQIGVTQANPALPVREHFAAPALWIVGVHGGAGESSLASLDHSWAAADHAWPVATYSTRVPNVLLVCRSSAAGLLAAQRAATQWAAHQSPTVNLLGLVVVADAPGRLPKALRDLGRVVGGGVPRVWHLAWLEHWRLGLPITPDQIPPTARELVADLVSILHPDVAQDVTSRKELS